MKVVRLWYLVILFVVVLVAIFYYFGKHIWGPVKLKLTGNMTVDEVLSVLKPKVEAKFADKIDVLTDGEPIALLAFKEERRLELRKKISSNWQKIKEYKFTGYSGKWGPKLKEGDGQIPEGIYKVEYLNPNSSYHLSFKINYPNEFDKKMAELDGRQNLGFDIFIHGRSATVGCIPVGDTAIEEIFYIIAKNGYENVKVIISPNDMRKEGKEEEKDARDSEDSKEKSGIVETNDDNLEPTWVKDLYEILEKELMNFK